MVSVKILFNYWIDEYNYDSKYNQFLYSRVLNYSVSEQLISLCIELNIVDITLCDLPPISTPIFSAGFSLQRSSFLLSIFSNPIQLRQPEFTLLAFKWLIAEV